MEIVTTGIDKGTYAQLFDKWYEPLRNFIYYKSKNIDLAEDIAQDVFLKIWEKREDIKLESVKSFMFTIANNLLINRFEHEKVALKFNNNFKPNDKTVSPEYEFEMKEFDRKLQLALNDLDEKKRTVFLMNRIDGLTYNEISENLGVTVKAVEKRMEKAISFMRQRIQRSI